MAKKVTIFHNTRCSKSREALGLLEDNNCEIELIEYMKDVPTKKMIKDLLMKLGLKPIDIIRKKEEVFIKKFQNKKFTDAEWVQIMIENPVLIERPIIVDGYTAIIGRPPVLVLDLLKRNKTVGSK